MNTIVKIKSCSRISASAKIAYNEERKKNRKKEILVLEKNDMPPLQTLSVKDKKEIKSLQTKISVYEKRLEKAIEDGKEKSIKTNQKNINEAKHQLAKYENNRQDKREKYFTEFTIALTNSQNESYANDWSKKTLEYIKQEFKELEVISAVEHKDQHSPHLHILLYSSKEKITQALSEYAGQKDTSRESMKKAYSVIANNFHSFANLNIAHNELKTLKKGRKYVSLAQYKAKGNFEAKAKIQNIKNFVEKIKKIFEIREYFMFEKETKTMYEDFLNAKKLNEQIVEEQEQDKNENDSFEASTATKTKKRQKF